MKNLGEKKLRSVLQQANSERDISYLSQVIKKFNAELFLPLAPSVCANIKAFSMCNDQVVRDRFQ